jgi:hypothetical protein
LEEGNITTVKIDQNTLIPVSNSPIPNSIISITTSTTNTISNSTNSHCCFNCYKKSTTNKSSNTIKYYNFLCCCIKKRNKKRLEEEEKGKCSLFGCYKNKNKKSPLKSPEEKAEEELIDDQELVTQLPLTSIPEDIQEEELKNDTYCESERPSIDFHLPPNRRSSNLRRSRDSSPRLFTSRGSTDSASGVQIVPNILGSSSSSSSSGSGGSVFSKSSTSTRQNKPQSNVSFAQHILSGLVNGTGTVIRPVLSNQNSISSGASTIINSSGGSTMQAEQGSIGDLQKYHNRYLRNRRHTLANVR